MDDFYTADDLFSITGRRQKSRQIEWLRKFGIRHTISITGHPRVHKSAFVVAEPKKPNEGADEPNYEATRARMAELRRKRPWLYK